MKDIAWRLREGYALFRLSILFAAAYDRYPRRHQKPSGITTSSSSKAEEVPLIMSFFV
jgi:hypothetical protein